jgi:hypothetical protein
MFEPCDIFHNIFHMQNAKLSAVYKHFRLFPLVARQRGAARAYVYALLTFLASLIKVRAWARDICFSALALDFDNDGYCKRTCTTCGMGVKRSQERGRF